MGVTTLSDYPAPPGNKLATVCKIVGPSTYAAVTTGSPPTGGQDVTAEDLGMVAVESVAPSASDDGQYFVYPIFPDNPARAVSTFKLMWITAAGGAEASGDLSSRSVRLHVMGF